MKTNEDYKRYINDLIDQFYRSGKKGTILVTIDTMVKKIGVMVENPTTKFKIS